jgi:uncharacterized protein YbaR (Trm112 family)
MALDPLLLEILACPEDKGPLLYFEDEDTLYNPRLRRRYRITDGIPVMLVDEAETVSEDENARLEQKAEADGISFNFDEGVPPSGRPQASPDDALTGSSDEAADHPSS